MLGSYLCKALLLLLCICFVSSCATSESWEDAIYEEDKLLPLRQSIVSTAKDQIGAAYQYAAKGPNSFDCSGLVSFVHKKNRLNTSGSSDHLSRKAAGIPVQSALPGDLIFFRKNNQVFHVSIITKLTSDAIWVVHSTSSKGVIEQNIKASTYWEPKVYKVISLDAFTN